jgi:hypothetical protein
MPRIFDNINEYLLSALQETLKTSECADFCVGYFNLRGWSPLAEYIDRFDGGEGKCCRLLVGMIVSPTDEMRRMVQEDKYLLDNQTAMKEKRRIAEEFKRQLITGFQSNTDEATLRKISTQIRSKKLFVRVYLRRPLHAKLYILYRQDSNNPVTGFLGSSNLTFAGLSGNGELNVDVLEHDACDKLSKWFDEQWFDRWCVIFQTISPK